MGCPPTSGCARAEWACGRAQRWRLTPAQHRAAAAAEVCGADLDASFCFVGRCAASWHIPRLQARRKECSSFVQDTAEHGLCRSHTPHSTVLLEAGLHIACRC